MKIHLSNARLFRNPSFDIFGCDKFTLRFSERFERKNIPLSIGLRQSREFELIWKFVGTYDCFDNFLQSKLHLDECSKFNPFALIILRVIILMDGKNGRADEAFFFFRTYEQKSVNDTIGMELGGEIRDRVKATKKKKKKKKKLKDASRFYLKFQTSANESYESFTTLQFSLNFIAPSGVYNAILR